MNDHESKSDQEVNPLRPFINRILQAGLAAAVVCGMLACVGPRKTVEQRAADRDMADQVQAALNADKLLFARHINVRADDGVVTLGGYVWTPPELEEARQIAQTVPGVTKVVDRLEVDRGDVQDSSVSH
jgi:hypothetical protein